MASIETYQTDELACAAGVRRFAAAMLAKLETKRKAGRGGWNKPSECSIESLRLLLREHVRKGDEIDIANLCMMLWNRYYPMGVSTAGYCNQCGESVGPGEWRDSHECKLSAAKEEACPR